MLKNHMKSIKGMSIACIVLAALSVFGMVAMGILFAVLGPYVTDAAYTYTPSVYDLGGGSSYMYDIDGLEDLYDIYDLYDVNPSSVSSTAVAAVMGGLVFLFFFAAILNVVCLIAGIIALRSCTDPQQYGKIFGWSIAGAICGAIGGGIAPLVLFIIMAVFSSKDKKLYQQGYFADPNGYFYQPAPGEYVQPGQPVGQPSAQPAPPVVAPLPMEAPAATQPAAPVEGQQPAQVATQPAAPVSTQPAASVAAQPETAAVAESIQPETASAAEPVQASTTEFQVVETETVAALDDGTAVEIDEVEVTPISEDPNQPQS